MIIGDVSLNGRHKPSDLSVLKTNIQHDGRGTIFTLCQNSLHFKVQGPLNNGSSQTLDFKGDGVFYTDRHDNKIGNSVEDREFLSMMNQTFHMDTRGNWTSPLPFKNTRPTLTNNMAQVFRQAINLDFYVDDALTSRPIVQEVLDAFPPDDLGKDIKDFSIGDDDNLVQHSLGLAWNLSSDCFIFQEPNADVLFTRRGILSKVNSIFDPIGFLSPLTICGKMILREMCTRSPSWDDPLPEEHRDRWESWSMSLDQLSTLRIPRMFVPSSLSLTSDPQVLISSDASETAIAAAAYLKVNHYIGFIMGKSKLAPSAEQYSTFGTLWSRIGNRDWRVRLRSSFYPNVLY